MSDTKKIIDEKSTNLDIDFMVILGIENEVNNHLLDYITKCHPTLKISENHDKTMGYEPASKIYYGLNSILSAKLNKKLLYLILTDKNFTIDSFLEELRVDKLPTDIMDIQDFIIEKC